MEKQLDGYVAIVTGSTKGIGKAIAKDFAMKGADVVVIGTNKERAEKVVKELEQLGSKSFYKILDVSDFDAVHQAMDKVLQKMGKIDILVNNAGITKDNLLMKMSE
ncbi:MAG: 3-oxoacyl-[acyl-carrier-protein] reductase FabG [Chlamydiae bacterium]|nr:3-oxoacyl-[acyl-carrier-protein] reductase FabG [Chlamydiota bacterium]